MSGEKRGTAPNGRKLAAGGSTETPANPAAMETSVREMPELELALLRRGVDARAADQESCHRCHRTPLIGERVYEYEHGSILCELCRSLRRDPPLQSRLVHTPEFGHTMRITDRRAA